MRRFILAVDHRHVNAFKSRISQQIGQFHLRKAEPHIGVHLARLFEAMLQQVHDDDAAAGFQNPPGFLDRLLRMQRVVQALVQQREVDFAVGERQFFQIA